VQYIVDVLDYTASRPHALLERATGPYFAFSLWVAARVLLVHGSTVDARRGVHARAADALVDALRRVGRAWRVAERYANLLQRVLDEYRESKAAPPGRRESETPRSVRLLADMRRTAFDLDALIARAPRTLLAAAAAAAAAAGGGGASVGAAPAPLPPPPPVAPAAPIDARHAEAAAAAAAANLAAANGYHSAPAAGISSPARTPAPADFEYLDLFDFFNYPRLPASLDGVISHVTATAGDAPASRPAQDGSYDAMGNDWLSQQQTLRAV
jgi:hypothetical protein